MLSTLYYSPNRADFVLMKTNEFTRTLATIQKRLITEELGRLTGADSSRSTSTNYSEVSIKHNKEKTTLNTHSNSPSPPITGSTTSTSVNGSVNSNTQLKLSDYPLQAINGIIDVVCQIQCKCIHRHCAYSYPEGSNLDVKVGTFVIIARDIKGHEDIGIVTRVFPLEAFKVKKLIWLYHKIEKKMK